MVLQGSFPLLGRLFGDKAFDMGRRRFEAFVSNTPTTSSACSLMTHWADMRARTTSAEPGLRPAIGPLALSSGVHQAGLKAPSCEDSNDRAPSCPRLQQALCEQIGQHQAGTLDNDLRQLPAILTTSLSVVPDPRLASWAEMCAIGRAFVARHPNWGYSPMCDEFKEMTAIYIGAMAPLHHSPLAAQLGVGNRVRSTTRRKTTLTLDEWGFALTINQEPAGLSTDSWKSHHAAAAYMLYNDALKAGLEGRMWRFKACSHASFPTNRWPT